MTLIMTTHPKEVEILILGAGWTSTFLIPLLKTQKISHAETTTTGRDGTLKFKFSLPKKDDDEQTQSDHLASYKALPTAKTILIVFPLQGAEETNYLVDSYVKTRPNASSSNTESKPAFIQLGSTGLWTIPNQPTWVTRHSPYNTSNSRAQAEDALLALGGCVLDLAGLWGGERNARHWIDRVAATKEVLATKKSLHMVHGLDVARGIVAVHGRWEKARGERWMLTDLMVYDWWALILGFAGELDVENGSHERAEKQIKWIGELMQEQNVRALPRDMESLGRCYDSRDFWNTFGIMPTRSRLSSVVIGGQY